MSTQYVLEVSSSVHEDISKGRFQLLESQIGEVFSGDTVACAFLLEEPSIPSVPFRRYLLGFDHPESDKEREMIIHLDDGSGKYDLIFRFKHGAFKMFEELHTDSTLVQWEA